MIAVADTGTGMPPEVLDRVFEPFVTTKEVGKGTGLGLALVFGIVKQHHGWIQVDNRPGEGVTFQIFLPKEDRTEVEMEPGGNDPKPPGGRETILLVDDELAVLKPTRKFLEQHGYRVLEATSGPEARRAQNVQRLPPDRGDGHDCAGALEGGWHRGGTDVIGIRWWT